MPQLFDGHIPLATSDLMLIIEIDLSDVPDWTRLRTLDHSAALRDALAATQLYPPADAPVVCRAHTTDGPATVSVAQALPHVDDPWCQDPAHRVRIEFLYSTTQPQLAIRIINHLPYSDGVTAVRTAFHTLEAFEGGKDAVGNGGEAFKKNPPFTFGPAHMLNMATVLGGGAAKALWPFTAPVSATEAAAPTTSAGLRAYYRTADAKPSAMRWYRAPANASPNATYKALVEALQAWGDRVGWKGFFTLLNFSPVAAASIVPKAADLTSIEKRYAGTFVPPGGPSGGRHWTVFNYIHVEVRACLCCILC